jgi:predicted nucleic acid-binding protein
VDFGRIYLDSNILISAFSGEAERGNAPLLMEMLAAVANVSSAPFLTSELSLAETLVRPFRNENQEAVAEFQTVVQPSAWLEVLPVDRTVLIRSAQLRAQRPALKLPDAIHLATALEAGCAHMLTADQGVHSELPVVIIRPEADTLRAIITWLLP